MANDAVAGNPLPAAPTRAINGADDPPSPTPHTPARPGALDPVLTEAIENTLTAFLFGEVDALAETDPAMGRFARIAGDCVLAGGKRLRPTFAYWGWRGVVGPQDSPGPILPALAALELLHTFALVHDDVMDASATRRGRPTAHRTFAAQHTAAGQTGDAVRFGEAGAVLVGDLCLVWADRMLAHSGLPASTLLEARRCYDQMRVETVAGQYLDILGETDARNWSVERALTVARYKTASYTVQRPLLFGAALAGLGRDVPLTAAYSRYGLAVGEAFQLCDDLLGVYGDPATTGKPAGDDLRNGKPTVLLMLARELADPAQRDELEGVLARDRSAGSPLLDDAAVNRLAGLVIETGAVRRVEQMIAERVEIALGALDTAPMDSAARDALTDLAVTATTRRA